jgi:hypothetical protein
MFDQRRRREIPEELGGRGNAQCVKAAVWRPVTHSNIPSFNGQNGGGR